MDSKYIPWGSGKEWLVWLAALVVATLFIHVVMLKAKEHGVT